MFIGRSSPCGGCAAAIELCSRGKAESCCWRRRRSVDGGVELSLRDKAAILADGGVEV